MPTGLREKQAFLLELPQFVPLVLIYESILGPTLRDSPQGSEPKALLMWLGCHQPTLYDQREHAAACTG